MVRGLGAEGQVAVLLEGGVQLGPQRWHLVAGVGQLLEDVQAGGLEPGELASVGLDEGLHVLAVEVGLGGGQDGVDELVQADADEAEAGGVVRDRGPGGDAGLTGG